jgi:acyl dehydratase
MIATLHDFSRFYYGLNGGYGTIILLTGQLQPHFQVLMGLGLDEVRLPNPVRPSDELDLEITSGNA